MRPPPTIAEIAEAYHARGFKPCHSIAAARATAQSWQKKPYDPRQFNGNAQNISLQMGEVSRGLTDIDCDAAEAVRLAPFFLPSTPAVYGRNSKPCSHWLYITDLWRTEKKAVIPFEDHGMLVELRCGGGGKGALSVAPPSMHVTGERVAWTNGNAEAEPARTDGAGLKRVVTHLAIACVLARYYPAEGLRHKGALALGGALVRAGWNEADIAHLVETLARDRLDDDVSDRVTAAISALNVKADGGELPGLPRVKELWGDDAGKFLGKWLGLRGPGAVKGGGGLEDAVALDFAEQHAGDVRYIAASSQWMCWTGARWQSEKTLIAFDDARKLCRNAGDARAKTVAAVTNLARADRRIAATIEQWDADLDLLNADGVTVDLKTGQTRAPDHLDYCTKQTSVAPAPADTTCDLWLKFLDHVTNKDDELIGFLKRFCGYCLSGHTYEHVLGFLYGTGANGKGTFIKTLGGILANYCVTSPIEMFLLSKFDRHSTELARLRSVRLTVAQETPKGRTWDEAKIKNMTGGDVVTARYMRADFFDFTPNFKVMIAGNYKPSLRDVDEAIRRRFLLIPFNVQIPRRERDPKLADKLKPEWPAILRWMIDGCLEWQRDGLGIPQAVSAATAEYFEDQDIIEQWLADCIKVDQMAFTPTRPLYRSWQTWCGERNASAGTEKSFVEVLDGKRYQQKRMKYGRGFKGIALINGGDTQAEADLGEGSG